MTRMILAGAALGAVLGAASLVQAGQGPYYVNHYDAKGFYKELSVKKCSTVWQHYGHGDDVTDQNTSETCGVPLTSPPG